MKENKIRCKIAMAFSRHIYTGTHGAIDARTYKKIAVLAHCDHKNRIADYVIHMCKSLLEWDCAVIFISVSPNLSQAELDKVKPFTAHIITRPNTGYDFGSYCIGYHIAQSYDYEQLIFINDSVFGPLYPFKVLDKHLSEDWDAFGIMDHLWRNTHYLNSYFWLMKKSMTQSPKFASIMENYHEYDKKIDLQIHCEMAILKDFKIKALCPYQTLVNLKMRPSGNARANEALQFWKEYLSVLQCPFIKRRAFKEEFGSNPALLSGDKRIEYSYLKMRNYFFNWATDMNLLGTYNIELIKNYYN